jgi:hypothetical protein
LRLAGLDAITKALGNEETEWLPSFAATAFETILQNNPVSFAAAGLD